MAPRLTLMIVDDDDDDRLLFVEAAKEVDTTIDCIPVSNAEDALLLLQKRAKLFPDFLFIDLNMPRVSGLELLTRIKEQERLKNLPVIIYSTSRSDEQKQLCRRLGATDFITKPENFEEIRKVIKRIINIKREPSQ